MKSVSLRVLPLTIPALTLALAPALVACSGEQPSDAGQSADAAPQSTAPVASIRDISVGDVDALLASEEGAVVLDVRTPAEFEAGHIDGAVSADFLSDDFANVIAQLDRDTTYILHCKSGSRSTKALEVMKEQGFTSVAHLTQGYDGWQAAQETP